jgi:hypothetical protein
MNDRLFQFSNGNEYVVRKMHFCGKDKWVAVKIDNEFSMEMIKFGHPHKVHTNRTPKNSTRVT